MPTKSAALLVESPQSRHFCQIHRNAGSLKAALAVFVESGLRRGETVLVIASGSRRAAVVAGIDAGGANAAGLQAAGRLLLLDGRMLLKRFMRGSMPDWPSFHATVGEIIESVSRPHVKLRIYGEMVSDLWRAGNPDAAICLEEFWNRLADHYRFSLYCGYELDGMDASPYAAPLEEIGRTHAGVVATNDDPAFLAAIDNASRDVLGIPVSHLLSSSGSQTCNGAHRLPLAYRTLWWLYRNMPSAMIKILRRAERYIEAETLR